MKKIFILGGIAVVVAVLLYAGLFIFVNAKGKDIVIKNIQNDFGAEVSLDSLSLKFPFSVEIRNFNCGDVSFKRANIYPGLGNLFVSRLCLDRVYVDGLKVKITGEKDSFFIEPFLSKEDFTASKDMIRAKGSASLEPVQVKAKRKKFPFAVKNLYLNNSTGEIVYLKKNKPLVVILEDVTLRLRSFTYPQLTKFKMKLNASLLPASRKKKMKGTLTIDGWADYSNKNMDMRVKVNNFDYFAFSDYYHSSWRPESFKLKEAILTLDSDLISKDNDLTIGCVLSLDKYSFKELSEEEQENSFKMRTLKTIIAFLKADKDKPTLSFKLKTKMDSPALDFASVKDTLKGVVKIDPIGLLEGVIDIVKEDVMGEVIDKSNGAEEVTVDKAVDIIKETSEGIVDILKDIFVPLKDTQAKE